MADRAVYHVTPYANGWTLNLEGQDEDKGQLGAWDHKDMAIARAKELAQEGPLGQVIVHGEDGRIQDEFTYGDDPRNIPG
ncbi:MAG: hypothetical protein QOG49_1209 [Frankiaceae bacterium]|jgi:hypothetical protein|nr:hypothetical protein [Frankiaceae bacterium]